MKYTIFKNKQNNDFITVKHSSLDYADYVSLSQKGFYTIVKQNPPKKDKQHHEQRISQEVGL